MDVDHFMWYKKCAVSIVGSADLKHLVWIMRTLITNLRYPYPNMIVFNIQTLALTDKKGVYTLLKKKKKFFLLLSNSKLTKNIFFTFYNYMLICWHHVHHSNTTTYPFILNWFPPLFVFVKILFTMVQNASFGHYLSSKIAVLIQHWAKENVRRHIA